MDKAEMSWDKLDQTFIDTVFDAVQSPPLSSLPVSLGKSWSLTISFKKIILKILELEITS